MHSRKVSAKACIEKEPPSYSKAKAIWGRIMKILKNKEDSLKFGLSLFLIAGSILGTLFCNRMSDDMKRELIIMKQSTEAITQIAVSNLDFGALMLQIVPKRMWTLILLLLAEATPMAPVLLMVAVGYFGFSNAVMISALTMEYGVRGLLHYMALIFPQCLLYIPVAYLLIWWMPANGKHLTVFSIIVLAGMVIFGCVLECFLNPRVIMLL